MNDVLSSNSIGGSLHDRLNIIESLEMIQWLDVVVLLSKNRSPEPVREHSKYLVFGKGSGRNGENVV